MLYYYKIGYYYEDGNDYIELQHKKEFNKEQFEDMFIESVLELLLNRRKKCLWMIGEEGEIPNIIIERFKKKYEEYKKNRKSKAENFDEFLKKHIHDYDYHYSRFMDTYNAVVDIMIEKYGFKKNKYKQKIELYGFVKVIKKDEEYRDKEEKRIFNRISKEYWKIKKNMIEIASIPSPGTPE